MNHPKIGFYDYVIFSNYPIYIQSLPRFDAIAGDAEDARATHCATGLQTVILELVSHHQTWQSFEASN